jgi:hypothetical protein
MAFKLAIDDKVGVRVEGKSRDKEGVEKPFSFILVCDRLTAEEMAKTVADKDETIFAFFEKVGHDWRKQTLVVDDDGKAAEFSVEALRVLMSMSGMAQLCWHSYIQQVAATAKN